MGDQQVGKLPSKLPVVAEEVVFPFHLGGLCDWPGDLSGGSGWSPNGNHQP